MDPALAQTQPLVQILHRNLDTKSGCVFQNRFQQDLLPIQREKIKNLFVSTSLLLLVLLLAYTFEAKAQSGNPSGRITGKKPPKGQCHRENNSECCEEGKGYTTFNCSPPVSSRTKAVLTLNSFQEGGDGGAASECDNTFHLDSTPVVALSTGWFNNMRRCLNNITVSANGRTVVVTVVDECDSTLGCDSDHDFQPPCPNNRVDASRAVWEALGVPENDRGQLDIFWSDA